MHAWLLAALLLAAQALGLAHRVAHAPGQGGPVGSVIEHDHDRVHAPPAWIDGHETDTVECRLIDQLAHADGLCGADGATAPALQASTARVAARAAAPRAGSASAYLARAPPLA